MAGNETGRKYYPELKLTYAGNSSVYGELSAGISDVLGRIKRRKVIDPTVGDGRIVPSILKGGNTLMAGDLNQTVDERGITPLTALAERFPGEVGNTLFLREMNAFGILPLQDGGADYATVTGFMYLFPVGLIQRHMEELTRVAQEGVVFDFATDIQRRRIKDGEPVVRTTAVDYSTKSGLEVVRSVLQHDYEPPIIGIEKIEQVLPDAGYTMTNTKLNVIARRRR